MYLATYSIGGTSWVQAAATLEYPAYVDDDKTRQWWARFKALLRGLDAVPQLSTSLRVHLGKHLEAAIFAVARQEHTDILRRAMGSLTQLDVLADGEIRYARDAAEHDALLR